MAEASTIELPTIPEIEQGPPLAWQPPSEKDLPYDDGVLETNQGPPLAWQPPSEKDLPYDDGVPMESDRHRDQMNLLIGTLRTHETERSLFVGGNMFIYYRATEAGRTDSVGPDVFVTLNVEQRDRKSWVIWNEGKGPDVVIELLSDSTANYDRTGKKLLYQDSLRVPEYFYYDPFSEEFAGFALLNSGYQAIQPDADGRLVSQRLQLALTRWHGIFMRNEATWLRWATLDGTLLPTGMELAEQERERADALAALLVRYQAQFGALDEAS